jgi:hypothetical protein
LDSQVAIEEAINEDVWKGVKNKYWWVVWVVATRRVGQNRMYALYMTVILVIFLPKTP